MPEPNALEALFPGPRRFVLCAMFHEPGRWWSLADLAGRAGLQPASLRLHMAALRTGGIVRERIEGGRAWFQADSSSPVFSELQSMIGKLNGGSSCTETILIVEDQPATSQITRILLESWGYRVIEAHTGSEALALFEKHQDAVRLVLTDVIMPGLRGPQLAAELLRRKPALRIVFMSGYSEPPNDRNAAFLPKPFNPGSLSRTIRRELDRGTCRRQPLKKLIADS
jgi:CheY-like chemotaxis protein